MVPNYWLSNIENDWADTGGQQADVGHHWMHALIPHFVNFEQLV